jgi:sulfite reductase beta subunit-like hemoprotein
VAAEDPLDLRPRIDRHAREGLASTDPDDLDIRFRWWGLYTQRPASDGREGFDLLVGGGLSSSTRFADRLGVFVPRDEAPEVVAAVTAAHRDHVGVHRQRDGANDVGVAPLVGRTDGDTLVEVAALARELKEAFPDFDGKIRRNVNGCPTSCARYQLSDIGLAGGESAGEGNYQLHLGGGLAFGHRVRERVPATETGAVVAGLVAGYLAGRETGESLQAWLRRQPPETLAAISKPAPMGST